MYINAFLTDSISAGRERNFPLRKQMEQKEFRRVRHVLKDDLSIQEESGYAAECKFDTIVDRL